MRVAVLTNILTPYRIPLFEAIHQRVDDLTILLMAESEENRLWKIQPSTLKTVVLPGLHIRTPRSEVSLHFNRGVFKALRECNPDIVLSGGFTLANFIALVYCRLYRKKYVQWAHLTLKDGAESSFLKRLLRILAT